LGAPTIGFVKKPVLLALVLIALCASARADAFGPWSVSLDVPKGDFPINTDTPAYDGTSTGGPGGLGYFIQDYTLTLTFQGSDVATMGGALTLPLLPSTPAQTINLNDFTLIASDNYTYQQTFGLASPLAGSSPNTQWTLDLFDTGDSGLDNTLLSWQLGITAVPEPSAAGLGLLAGALLLGRRCRLARRFLSLLRA
jgi:hypothetical protein